MGSPRRRSQGVKRSSPGNQHWTSSCGLLWSTIWPNNHITSLSLTLRATCCLRISWSTDGKNFSTSAFKTRRAPGELLAAAHAGMRAFTLATGVRVGDEGPLLDRLQHVDQGVMDDPISVGGRTDLPPLRRSIVATGC